MPALLRYPVTPRRPEPNRIGGLEFEDDYQWLERATPEVFAWQAAQDRFAARRLRATPVWSTAIDAVRRFTALRPDHPPERYGRRWFRERVPTGARHPVLEVSDIPTGPGRVLVDPNLLGPTATVALDWQPSPDGWRLAYSLTSPDRLPLFRVLNVNSGETVVDGLPELGTYRVTWLPDSRRFFCVVLDRQQPRRAKGVFLARLAQAGALLDLERQALPPAFPVRRISVSPDGRWALAYGPGRPFYLRDLSACVCWRPFLRGLRGTFRGVIVGDELIAVTDDGAPRGRVVAIPLAGRSEDRSAWRELVPSSNAVLVSITTVGTDLVLSEYVDGATRLRRISPGGEPRGEITLPEPGMVRPASTRAASPISPAGNGCTFAYSSITRAPATYRYDLTTSSLEELTRPQAAVPNVVVHNETARGADDTPIPYKIVTRSDIRDVVPRPLLIGAHGARNLAWLPAYRSAIPAAWVHLGGIYVHAHLRGGGEYGSEWWRAARRRTKHVTFEDLHAIASDLIRQGCTTSDRIGVLGTALGALPAAVAVTRWPELFRACVLDAPVLDLLRCKHDPATMAMVGVELGDPDDPGDAATLHDYSPYHRIRDGVRYPAVLVDCGAADRTCPAWHGRKVAARLQSATTAEYPVLLRVRQHHAETEPADVVLRETEQLAFLMAELGLRATASRGGRESAALPLPRRSS
ncbi:prolyl endopeptidase [Longimycelium tulufanense]|uniref:Prolyl endopeptidase n=1 Tax=Longimycelium tulufanense TaxID=907463 RepID=A0A8J3CH14_9PSEU|nr:prolyl oligopeptidase family serine peptidase [Longimycelium tulufanense]GGM59954.1 prolyl endopeptidase [Longimycelium tulufanense]